MFTLHVGLGLARFSVQVRPEGTFEESPFVYVPYTIVHIASGQERQGIAESADPKRILGEYTFAEDLATFYRDLYAMQAPDKFAWLDCVEPGCPAWYDETLRDRPVGDSVDPARGPFFTGWIFPQDAETHESRDEEGREYRVHDHVTEDGEGRS